MVISEVVNEIIKIQEYSPEDGTPVEYKFENMVAKTNRKAFFSRIFTRKSKNADKIKVKKYQENVRCLDLYNLYFVKI